MGMGGAYEESHPSSQHGNRSLDVQELNGGKLGDQSWMNSYPDQGNRSARNASDSGQGLFSPLR